MKVDGIPYRSIWLAEDGRTVNTIDQTRLPHDFRTTARGDVGNRIGTCLEALDAHDSGVRLYVALPSPTIDWRVRDALRDIPIEERSGIEVTHVQGRDAAGAVAQVQISPDATPGANAAFDVTPARLVAGLITECGIVPATAEGLAAAFPDLMEDAA
jgi:methylthioribose-1-phosphate isomerase